MNSRTVRLLAALAALLLVASGCDRGPSSTELKREHQLMLQTECFAAGGVYFEYEDTSAGEHVWCATVDGESIDIEYRGDN